MIKIDYARLNWWLSVPIEQIFREFTGKPDRNQYYYKDNGSDILSVAHLDTVCRLTGITSMHEKRVCATGLDDRLGAYAVMELLPSLGVKADIVLTDGEESGRSTMKLFKSPRPYKWAFEFDRAETDVVTYGRETPEFKAALKPFFKDINHGAFSDVAVLDSKCCVVNVGTGLDQMSGHSEHSWFNPEDFIAQTKAFLKFYAAAKETEFPCETPTGRTVGFFGEGTTSIQGGVSTTRSTITAAGDFSRKMLSCGKKGKGKQVRTIVKPGGDRCWYCNMRPIPNGPVKPNKETCVYCGAADPYEVICPM